MYILYITEKRKNKLGTLYNMNTGNIQIKHVRVFQKKAQCIKSCSYNNASTSKIYVYTYALFNIRNKYILTLFQEEVVVIKQFQYNWDILLSHRLQRWPYNYLV